MDMHPRVLILGISYTGRSRVLGFGYLWCRLLLHGFNMNRGFLDSGGRKNNHRKKMNLDSGNGSLTKVDGNMNDATMLVAMEVVSPFIVNEPVAQELRSSLEDTTNIEKTGLRSYPPLPTHGTTVVDLMIEKDKLSSLEDTIVLESFPPLSTPVTTAGNAPGKSSYANITSKPSGKKVNVCTFFTPVGNGIDLVVLVDSIRAISERFANTDYGFFLGKKVAYPAVASYARNTWDAMLENGPWFMRNNPLILKKWHPNEIPLKEDVSNVPVWVKLHGVLVTAFSEDGLIAIATKLVTPLMLDSYTSDMSSSSKVFRHIHEECPKNTGAGKKKTVKKPSQTSRGVPVGPKMGFQKEYRPVHKKPSASSSGNNKKGVEPTIEVSNLNPFDVLISVDNDMKFGTNGGTTNLVNNEATSSGSPFMNIDNDGEFASNNPIYEEINKIECQICEGKLRLLDNDKNLLVSTGTMESDSEVEVVFDETANLRISTSGKDGSDKGYGTNSLLEQ
nr:hypothetical protein [Tanacetum cinerariifolium]